MREVSLTRVAFDMLIVKKKIWLKSFAATRQLHQGMLSDATKAQSSHGLRGQRRVCFLHELLVFITLFWDQQAKTWMFLFPNVICNRETVQTLVIEELFSHKSLSSAGLLRSTCQKRSLSTSPSPRFLP